jgi:hypothetical protein
MSIPKFSDLQFDERSHVYTLGNAQLPSVTTIMRPLSNAYYGGIDDNILAAAANRGTSIHQAIENYLTFGVSDAPPEHVGYFNAFLQWYETVKPEVVAAEYRSYHRVLMYAGTVDLVYRQPSDALICVDFKTSSQVVDMLVRVQLEAYRKACDSHEISFTDKHVVLLRKDGTCEVTRFGADTEAWEVFTSLLTTHNYLKKYGR